MHLSRPGAGGRAEPPTAATDGAIDKIRKLCNVVTPLPTPAGVGGVGPTIAMSVGSGPGPGPSWPGGDGPVHL